VHSGPRCGAGDGVEFSRRSDQRDDGRGNDGRGILEECAVDYRYSTPSQIWPRANDSPIDCVRCSDETGVIGEGTHHRALVVMDEFWKRVLKKAE